MRLCSPHGFSLIAPSSNRRMASERGIPRRLAQVSSRSRRCCGMRALTSGSGPVTDRPSLRFVGFAGFTGIVRTRKGAGRTLRSLPVLLCSFYSARVPPDAIGMTNETMASRVAEEIKERINCALMRSELPTAAGSSRQRGRPHVFRWGCARPCWPLSRSPSRRFP